MDLSKMDYFFENPLYLKQQGGDLQMERNPTQNISVKKTAKLEKVVNLFSQVKFAKNN